MNNIHMYVFSILDIHSLCTCLFPIVHCTFYILHPAHAQRCRKRHRYRYRHRWTHIHISVYIYIYTYTRTYTYLQIDIDVDAYTHIYIYIFNIERFGAPFNSSKSESMCPIPTFASDSFPGAGGLKGQWIVDDECLPAFGRRSGSPPSSGRWISMHLVVQLCCFWKWFVSIKEVYKAWWRLIVS